MFRIRGSQVVASGIALVSALTMVTAGSAQAANGAWQIVSTRNGLCLDADNSNGNRDGMKVQLWGCDGKDNQKWVLNGDMTIRNVWSGRCLDADNSGGLQNGSKVQLWSCGSGSNQRWAETGNPGPMLNRGAGKVLDANIFGPNVDRNGMQVQIWGQGSPTLANQIWRVVG